MSFDADSLDLILCNNRLPDVSYDHRAPNEMRRFFKSDGRDMTQDPS